MKITKRIAKERLGFRTDAELVEFFGITKGAVSQWPEDAPLPELRQAQLMLRERRKFADHAKAA